MEISAGRGCEKTKPIQSQTKPIAGFKPEILNNPNIFSIIDLNALRKGCYLKKQSQFIIGLIWRNISNDNGLWRSRRAVAVKKQSQSKPIF